MSTYSTLTYAGMLCTHGQSVGQCPLCEKDAEIERLRKEVEELKALAHFGYYCLDEMSRDGWIQCKADWVARRLGLMDSDSLPIAKEPD